MNTLARLATAISLTPLIGCASLLNKKPEPADVLASWRGPWELALRDGSDQDPMMADANFDKNKLAVTRRSDERRAVFSVVIDPAQQPPTIDMSAPSEDGGALVTGRYALQVAEGVEHLTFCFPKRDSDPRPALALPCDGKDELRMELTRPAK